MIFIGAGHTMPNVRLKETINKQPFHLVFVRRPILPETFWLPVSPATTSGELSPLAFK